ncbi:MAG: adenylate cyclase [Parcubacteria group bacterium Licking1014_17]|nr:MAG: adenylate cyclase [Parcubacteria group bacterium Licking1014_17]
MKNKTAILGIGITAGVLVWLSFYVGLFKGFEYFIEDRLVSEKPVSPDILILSVDNESISRIGQWPWPRSVFARALDKMHDYKPAVLGIDVIFSEPSRFGSADDMVLSQAIGRSGFPVVMTEEASPLIIRKGESPFLAGNVISTLPIFTKNSNVALGHVNLVQDKDGVVRRLPYRIETNGPARLPPMVSFSSEVARLSGKDGASTAGISPSERIVYAGPPGSVRQISFYRILEEEYLVKSLKNKIILIGATSPDLHDEKLTPVSKGTEMPGVEIQAQAVNMFLKGYRLFDIPDYLSALWVLLAAVIASLVFLILNRPLAPILANVGLGVIYSVAILLLFDAGKVANFLHINLAWTLPTILVPSYRYFAGEKEKQKMKRLFGKYVSKSVLNEILKNPDKVKIGGEEREITVLFSDIRGFTTLSEKMESVKLVSMLNRYFEAMTEQIIKYNGVLDKYIGDAIMAFWGAPIADEKQADNAIKAAKAMLKSLVKLNEELAAEGFPEINIGIGLHSGIATVGNFGSRARFDYTAIGDTVNVASRLEGLNKEYGMNIIISEITKQNIKENYEFKRIGNVTVKGRQEPINIYTIK